MSEQAVIQEYKAQEPATRSFVSHAKLIGAITFVSRLLGLAREMVAANYFGAGVIWSAWKVAFTIPNLFRKLLGEGALSAAFIPLYAQAIERERGLKLAVNEPTSSVQLDPSAPQPEQPISAAHFAAASVNLLALILIGLTIIGEVVLLLLALFVSMRDDYLLAVKLAGIMLPYVLLVCGTAFLSGILNVHHRFAATSATSIVLNLFLIVAIVILARMFNLKTLAGQQVGVHWLSFAVLLAGIAQIVMLLPSLNAVGFRFTLTFHFWTPAIQKMLRLTVPVALSAGVLQIGVMLDKGISFLLARNGDHTHFALFGHLIRYPMQPGAAARLDLAQFMYQFPLGVFAIALATAIFPRLSTDALDEGRVKFKNILRQGVEASLFIGLPASIGMVVVRYPAIRLLFQQGNFTAGDTAWVARSTALYCSAIWAFSLLQIISRAYYAMHDTTTPLVWAAINLAMNLVIELPLIWTGLGESGMAVGTLVSFAIQAVAMLWMLDRRVGGLKMSKSARPILKMVIASLFMWIACVAVQYVPHYPQGNRKIIWASQLTILMVVGGTVYFAACGAMGIDVMKHVRRRSKDVVATAE
jgi:putative peptidoglycan lipid II flippase